MLPSLADRPVAELDVVRPDPDAVVPAEIPELDDGDLDVAVPETLSTASGSGCWSRSTSAWPTTSPGGCVPERRPGGLRPGGAARSRAGRRTATTRARACLSPATPAPW
jgi:hypothetical protein